MYWRAWNISSSHFASCRSGMGARRSLWLPIAPAKSPRSQNSMTMQTTSFDSRPCFSSLRNTSS